MIEMEIQRIDTLDNVELRPYRTMRRAVEHVKQGIFVAEGEKVVRRLLESQNQVVSLLLTDQWLQDLKPILKQKGNSDTKVWVAPKQTLETIVGFHLHQGLMAIGRIPEPQTLDDAISRASKPHLLVALDRLSNADNVGVIMRNCAAFGVDALIVPKNSSSPYLRRSVRMSMGAVFCLPIVQDENLTSTLHGLKEKFATRIIAAHPRTDARPIEDEDFNGDVCIVFGSEGSGISEAVLETCSEKVSIRMLHGTDSLNVATASGILLYEAQRQRKAV
jgi:tRNA G18 (ribose-2'-O)-methylase SpoU